MSNNWSDPISSNAAFRRASGRRRHNALKQFRATLRRAELMKLIKSYGFAWGNQARFARILGVSPSVISRDMRVLLEEKDLAQLRHS